MENIKIHKDSSNKCYLCRRSYGHKRAHWIDSDNGLKLVELITHCPRCRNLCKKRNNLAKQIMEIDWILYGLQNTNYFDT